MTTVAPTTTSSTTTTTTLSNAIGIVPIDGTGDQTVALPASVGRPAIVHAHYAGAASFVITGVDANTRDTAILANSLGPYEGTFPVGFVDPIGNPTVSLHIATTGPWHLDIGSPRLAPQLVGGISGDGDAVLSYTGPPASAHLTLTRRSSFIVSTYATEAQRVLASGIGPYSGVVSLRAGPTFVAVRASGNWSIIIR